MNQHRLHSPLATAGACLAAAAMAFTVATPSAEACGGFFCSARPVDQNAERIIFRVNTNNTVTAIVQIVYSGAPEDFSWVVPIPAVADLEVFPDRAITALDTATQPVFTPPWQCLPLAADADGAGPPAPAPGGGGGVTVEQRQEVGPFETVTVSSEDPEALVTWLRDNGYRITTAMEPFVKLYVDEGMLFLAMKLKPGEETAAVQPIMMTYTGTEPSIPIRLTAVAAEPEMGIIAWVLGEQRFGPDNYADIEIPDSDIRFDSWSFQTNYLEVVSRRVDEAGGHAFVTEFAGSSEPLAERMRNAIVPPDDEDAQAANDAIVGLLESAPYLTRLYSKVNPEEMSLDPAFRPVDGDDVSNIHDLSDREELCEDFEPPPPCDMTYCGNGAECRIPADDLNTRQAACACLPGQVARVVQSSRGFTTTCQDSRMRFPNESGAPAFDDPCDGVTCGGAGTCVNMNGTATCSCAMGFVAHARRVEGDSNMWEPSCVAPNQPLPNDFYNRLLPELPELEAFGQLADRRVDPDDFVPPTPRPTDNGGSSGCAQSGGAPSLLALAGLALIIRRRRR